MLLQFQRYYLEVQSMPGPQMFIADHLSGDTSTIKANSLMMNSLGEFLELEEINPLDTVKITSQ